MLVGATTYKSRWVRYEITKAWNDLRPLIGIRIHGLLDKNCRTADYGQNPFECVKLGNSKTIADYVHLIDPTGGDSKAIYNNIEDNLTTWVHNCAYKRR